jgi:hypothetical protein
VTDRPYEFSVDSDDWEAAAQAIVEVINGVGYFHFDSVQDAIDSGPYDDAEDFVRHHLHWMREYAEVYGDYSPKHMFERRLR